MILRAFTKFVQNTLIVPEYKRGFGWDSFLHQREWTSSLPSLVLAGGACFGLVLAFPFVFTLMVSVISFYWIFFLGIWVQNYWVKFFLTKFPLLTKLEIFYFKCKNDLIFGVFNWQILIKIILKISMLLCFLPVVRTKKF